MSTVTKFANLADPILGRNSTDIRPTIVSILTRYDEGNADWGRTEGRIRRYLTSETNRHSIMLLTIALTVLELDG